MRAEVEGGQVRSGGSKLSTLVREYPALCLAGLAMMLGAVPASLVAAGLIPSGASQLGALSASAAGIILAGVEGRRHGVRELLGRFLIWRVGFRWWAFVLLFPVIPAVITLYVYHLIGGPAVDWSGLKPLHTVVPMMIMLTVAAGIGEEFGWRGFALPRLQARYNAFTSSVIIGIIWGMWHTLLFFIPGTVQYEWRMNAGPIVPIMGYTLFLIASSIQFTWVFNNTRGSVLLAAVMHGAGNAWIGGYIDVYRGHFGGVLVFMAVSLVVSAILVLAAGPTHLSRTEERNRLEPESD
jgi:CAAX protease family protein